MLKLYHCPALLLTPGADAVKLSAWANWGSGWSCVAREGVFVG